jgi:hypothetical protein
MLSVMLVVRLLSDCDITPDPPVSYARDSVSTEIMLSEMLVVKLLSACDIIADPPVSHARDSKST